MAVKARFEGPGHAFGERDEFDEEQVEAGDVHERAVWVGKGVGRGKLCGGHGCEDGYWTFVVALTATYEWETADLRWVWPRGGFGSRRAFVRIA